MLRKSWVLLSLVLLIAAGTVQSADDGVAGTWKVMMPLEGQQRPLWLVKFEAKEGKWTGKVAATAEVMPPTTLVNPTVNNGIFRFGLKLENGPRLNFEGKLPQEKGQKIFGSMQTPREPVPTQLELTTLPSLDSYELARELLATQTAGPEVIEAATTAIKQAGDKKAKPEEVRSWADKALKAAEPYGPRLQRHVTMKIAGLLTEQEGLAPVALEYARRAERLLEPKDKPNIQMQVLDVLAEALKKAGKADEAKEIESRISKIELVKPEPFAGRNSKSARVVLVELFTGAQCRPCVAADMAFDALHKTYKPTEVVCLQYHEHIPGPDPLTNPDSEARMKYYGRAVRGTPTIIFNGTPDAGGGGGRFDAQDKYEDYQSVILPLLETAAKAKLKVSATQKESKIDITAEVADLDEPGENMRLRLVLVEETVSYKGGNQLEAHHSVVRALPGGADGLALKEKTGKQTASVDLGELRKSLNQYLDEAAKEDPFPNKDRPLELKKLRVVAFIQNNANKEVLQAVQTEVGAEK